MGSSSSSNAGSFSSASARSSGSARSSSQGSSRSSRLFCSEAFCACPRSHLRAIEFKKVVVVRGYPHAAVEVLYKCNDCDHELRVTYDLVGMGEKRERCGHYRISTSNFFAGHTFRRYYMSYEDIGRIFDRMTNYYNLVSRNCIHWANQFIERLEDYC